MPQSQQIHSKNGAQKSEEFERMPLKQRLKLLFAGNRIPVDSELKSEKIQKNSGHEKEYGNQCATASGVSAKFGTVERGYHQESLAAENPVKVKIECGESNAESCLRPCVNISNRSGVEANSDAEMNIEFLDELDHVVLKDRLRKLLASEYLGSSSSVLEASHNLPGKSRILQMPDVPSLANVKVEHPNAGNFQSSKASNVGQMSYSNFVRVKTEVQTACNAHEDDLDHMLLSQRMKLMSSRDAPSLNTDRCPNSMSKRTYSASSCRVDQSKPVRLLKTPRKRRKTATDSIETAMEEDAPGLLQVLIEKGVMLDEIKLYGEPEINDDLDDSSLKDSFGELEEVISKLFSQRESLLKYGPLRCSKGEGVSYCLESLFSLVEQACYLRFRHWPVEWGWCRDLQSFIFVFEKHNRIVLERPEYGYATYFFELEDTLPINWQVKRLVTAMKLTSCGRITLIENKPLMVGDDLTEGEARVLMEYGWIPNTGLGTMLNYYNRVVHDRRNERDGSEWRSKIGKLLVEGYNGGTIIPTAIPTKVMEYNAETAVQIKLELS